ncbi:murein biosynthesis integral membrane protein MurJ [Pseudemcibacter aquimaris]|uniref:murein biosynthesis integral membrane protein MurJ n=1 Tax=Pseudemcibacter aquimaris TaxID=2857064 RepID=UPI00201343B1|nr:murein biosynthesis integral membrane protein MurJ [Pseudemcibacter aquimaris]MCC3862362.1 murein biosynthesis integral membrane protein MurJ [Pseudemcibacter aquimaris]WDU59207.1 murein biosynthesis integral membrane protein MurJ [Pseudemcibacter aquimaris]
MSVIKSTAIFGAFTMISRILGFVRDILMAAVLGAGMITDCFVVAFKLPNFFRRLFAEGAFSASFVPIFSATLEKDGKEEALKFAEEAFACLFMTLLLFVGIVEIFTPALIYAIANGFTGDEAKFSLAVVLTRFTFPFILFVSLGSLLAGILNSLGRFAETAAVPIILNICMISALMFASNMMETPAHTLAIGVSIAGFLQVVFLYRATRKAGYKFRIRAPKITPKVKKLLIVMGPAALGAGVVQLNLLLDMIIASHLPDASMSYLYYADRLNQLPVGVIGVALGTVLLPFLSRSIAAGNETQVMKSQNQAIEMGLFFTIPAAVAFIIVPAELIHVLLERSNFTALATTETSLTLAAYAAGLPAYVLAKVFVPGYFARSDTKTPLIYAIVALVINVSLNLILMQYFLHVGLAMATAISAWINVFMLAGGLIYRGHYHIEGAVIMRLLKYVMCSVIMGGVVWYLQGMVKPLIWGNMSEQLLGLSILVVSGIGTYLIATFLTGTVKKEELKAVFSKR